MLVSSLANVDLSEVVALSKKSRTMVYSGSTRKAVGPQGIVCVWCGGGGVWVSYVVWVCGVCMCYGVCVYRIWGVYVYVVCGVCVVVCVFGCL